MQEALNALNGQSPELVNGSSSFRSALGKLQEALNSVSVTSEDLTALTDASSAIKSGIDDLVAGCHGITRIIHLIRGSHISYILIFSIINNFSAFYIENIDHIDFLCRWEQPAKRSRRTAKWSKRVR
mgnify:CR=1 FL=1